MTHRTATKTALLAIAATAAIAVGATSIASARSDAGATVKLRSTAYGKVLADGRGRTLYLFQKDRTAKSRCSGQCATFWPPLLATGKPVAGAGVRGALLGTTKRTDGRLQVTYNRHPLYRFANDRRAGQTKGQDLEAFGAEWYVVSAAGRKVEHKAGTDDDSGPGSGGGDDGGSGSTVTDPGYGY